MPTDRAHFREVMSRFATGVSVVTSRAADGRACGLTANALTSVSLDPLLILVCLDLGSATLGCVMEGRAFAVNLLTRDARELARRFSRGRRASRFREVPTREEVTGSPILEDALGWLDCEVDAVHEAGDHAIVVGEVKACGVRDGEPLVFYRGAFRELGP